MAAGLTLFSACQSVKSPPEADVQAVLDKLAPPRPLPPVEEPVVFEEKDGGLWLSYENYRALERNIIEMRRYMAQAEAVLDFYEEK